MNYRFSFSLIAAILFTSLAHAQCIEVTSIFVNACTEGTGSTNCTQEGPNEMFTFEVGATDLFVGDIAVNWPNNSFQGWCNSASTALKTDTLNSTITSSCGWLIEPLNDTIPAGYDAIVITSADFCAVANSFAGLADTMYILFQCAGNVAGHFANSPSGTRTLQVILSGPCTQVESVSYDGAIPNSDGATAFFDAAGAVSYSILGCNAPVLSISADWSFSNEICNDYGIVNLPGLLSGNATAGGTWIGPRVNGTTYNPSGYLGLDSITYLVVGSGTCTDSISSTIVFNVSQAQTGASLQQSCDSVFVNGMWYASSTTFTDTIFGFGFTCDSFVNYTITIDDAYTDSTYLSACESVAFEGNTYTADTIFRDTIFGGAVGPIVIDTILQTGFEDAEGWIDHSSGNWTETDLNGTWNAVGMYANQFNPNNGNRNVGLNTVGDYLEFPPVSNPSTLFYYDRLSSAPTSFNELSIEYFDGATWQVLATDSCAHTDYRLTTIDLTAISGLNNVAMRIFRSLDNRSAYIDDIVIVGSTTSTGSSCDSITITNIDVLQAVSTNNPGNPFLICATNDSIQLPGGDFASTAGTYNDTLVAVNGCDSIVTTIVQTQSCSCFFSVIVNDQFCNDSAYTLPSGLVVSTPGTYVDTIVIASACDSIVTTNLTVVICSCGSDLGPDTSFCQGESIVLDAGLGFDDYQWQDNSSNQTFTATSTGTYYCTTTFVDSSNNLVVNGDFEQGNTGFTSDYGPGVGGAFGLLTNPGTYAISTSPSNVHNNFFSCVDNTSGTGNLMIINGSNTTNTNVWCQTINVSPNTDYMFSAWAISLENTNISNVATLHFLVNGVQIGLNFSPSLTACNWQQFFANYNSGSNTSIEICIESDVISGNNDYGIDDIFFTPFCNSTDSIDIIVNTIPSPDLGPDVSICFGNDTLLDATTSNASYLWQDGSTSAPTFTAQNGGTYWVDVTVNNCTARDSLEVLINPVFNETSSVNICAGDSVFLENSWQNIPGVYTDNFVSVSNCDSIIVTTLNVQNSQTTNDLLTVCADALPVDIFGNLQSTPGIYVDTLSSSLGCDSIITSVELIVNTLPIVSLGQDTSINTGDFITINIDNPNNNEIYSWVNDLGESYSGSSIQANNAVSAEYILTVTNQFNCLNYDTIIVIVNPIDETFIQIPTAFSPNGDGVNDVFRIANYDDFSSYILRVYNRWGELVFDNQGYNVAWAGSYQGLKQNIGVYTFYIEAQPANAGSVMKTSGTVSLIR